MNVDAAARHFATLVLWYLLSTISILCNYITIIGRVLTTCIFITAFEFFHQPRNVAEIVNHHASCITLIISFMISTVPLHRHTRTKQSSRNVF